MKSAPAKYFDGISPNAIAGVLTVTASGLRFAVGPGAATETIQFSFAQMTEATASGSDCRITIFIDAAESRELRFADRGLLEYARRMQRENSGGLRKALLSFGGWSTGRKVLVGALMLPLSIGAFLFGLEGAHIFVPESADRRLGEQAAVYLESDMEICEDPVLNDAVAEMMTRLVGEAGREKYTVQIVRQSEVNALALPHGGIYLFSGLLEESETPAEVAGVLAHEIGHIQERHSMRQLIQAVGFTYLATMLLGAGFEEFEAAETISELASLAVFFKYSRDFEKEADLHGINLLRDAGLSGQGLLDFFARRVPDAESEDAEVSEDLDLSLGEDAEIWLEEFGRTLPDFLSTHPADAERVGYLREALSREQGGENPTGDHPTRAGAAGALRPLSFAANWSNLRGRCAFGQAGLNPLE
ncbi:MAG: M48 family metallopeptidase [bacterium]|nr:M48 family metallopeptidase [bacterium]